MCRSIIRRFLFVCLTALSLSAQAGITHRWQFNETTGTNLADSVGSSTASVVVLAGAGGYTFTNGAVRLDGGTRTSADYVQLPPTVFDGLTNATIEIWAEPHSFPNWGRLIELCEGDVLPNPTTNNLRLSWSVGVNGNQQRFGWRPYTAVDTALTTATNTLYHYAIVLTANGGPNGESLAVWYRNGALVASQLADTYTMAAFTSLANRTIWLARSAFTVDSTANASYHEMRIYDHPMSGTEVLVSGQNGPDTLVIPPAQASGLTLSTNLSSRLVAEWTKGAGSTGTVIIASRSTPPVFEPVNGTTYTGNPVFGAGFNWGSSNFVVYAGTGTNVTITNLQPGVVYYTRAFSYSSGTGSNVYNLAYPPTASSVVPANAQSISLSTPATMIQYATAQATVTADYGGGFFGDVTATSTYTSSAPSVVSVAANGSLQALAAGNAWITASFQGKVSSNNIAVLNQLTNNLVHRYPFTADASDIVGTAHGTLQGGAVILTNNCVFNGSSAFVNLPNNLVTGLTSFTIETWVTDLGSGGWGRIFDFGNNNAGEDLQGTGTEYMFMSLPSGAGNLRFAVTAAGGGGEQLCEWAGNRPAVGAKAHITITLDDASNTARLYVNGAQVGINTGVTLTPAALGGTVNNWLGKSVWPDPYFNGVMDEFRIYDIALPASIVMTNYLNGPDGIPTMPPTLANDSMTLNPGAKAMISVLANDSGPAISASTLEVVNPPANGTATIVNGKIRYAHNGSPATSDAFTYRVQNVLGATSSVATVSLTISNTLRLTAPTLAMPSSPPPTVLQLVDALPGATFNEPICISTIPGDAQRLFVCERMARVMVVTNVSAAQPSNQVFLDMQQVVAGRSPVETIANWSLGENGLLGLAFHPGYATNGYFYAAYTVQINNGSFYQRISRFSVSLGNPNQANPASELILLQQLDRGFNHNGGDLHFGPDGYLYYAAGDEENPNDFRLNSQFINKGFHSGIFRIDVDKRPGSLAPNPHASIPTDAGVARFAVPTNNPFVYTSLGGTWNGTYNGATLVSSGSDTNLATIRTEFWATGLRHPWRMSFDALTGDLWAGDVGQGTYEEINLIVKGGNYGWVYREGAHDTGLRLPVPPGFTSIDPVYEYLHTGIAGGDPQFKGNSVCGGVVYRGTRLASLYGHYIWCDSVSGHIWGRNPTNGTVTRLTGVAGAYGGLVSMGVDPSNQDVLFCDYINGRILRLTTGTVESGFPQTLSDTGAFADLTDLAPNPGIVRYDPIVPFWSDHAIKSRWFVIPDATNQFTHVTDGNWSLPNGSVWVKHFDMEMIRGNPATKKRLETRFIVKNSSGNYGVSYAWNAAGTEAYLVPDSGTNFNLTITNGLTVITQQWAIPSRNECLACHTAVGGHALSFNTRQLNQYALMNGYAGNQLSQLSGGNYFANAIPTPATLPAFSAASNSAASLEHRVRSYFAVNCVQCHQSGGGAPATWDARAWLSLEGTSLINGFPNNNGGNPANKLVVPGDTAHSIVLQRIRGNGFSRMPPLATAVIDEVSTNLLHTWISTELTNRQSFAQWQLATFGSTNAANALATADPDADGANNYYEYLTQTSPTNAVPAPWKIAIDAAAGTVSVEFQRIANLGFLVETTASVQSPVTWTHWDVPANTLWFSASNFTASITGPLTGTNQFFRVRLVEP